MSVPTQTSNDTDTPIVEGPVYDQPPFGPDPKPAASELDTAAQPAEEDDEDESWYTNLVRDNRIGLAVSCLAIILSLFTLWSNAQPHTTTYTRVQPWSTGLPHTNGRHCTGDKNFVNGDSQMYYCITDAQYDTLVTQAKAELRASIARGKAVYDKWTARQGLDPKTKSASMVTARAFICNSDSFNGSQYAATLASVSKTDFDWLVDDKYVTVEGFNPDDVTCSGYRIPSDPSVKGPYQKLPPKDSSQDPAVQGNVPSWVSGNGPWVPIESSEGR